MKKLIILLIVAAALGYGILSHHFVVTDDGLKVLKKTSLAVEDTFVDARGIKAHKLLTNPALVKAGIKDAIE